MRIALVFVLLAGVALGVAAGLGAFNGPSPAQLAQERAAARQAAEARARARLLAKEQSLVQSATGMISVALPTRIGTRVPQIPSHLFARPLPAHLVFGFVPYWALGTVSAEDLADSSIVAYYGIAVRGDGSLSENDPGWTDFEGAGFAAFVADAHAVHDRVLLTVYADALPTIGRLLAHPVASAARLAAQLQPLLVEDRLDGVDIDIEGRNPAQEHAFVQFLAELTGKLRASDPAGELVLDTYPQSAGETSGFFDLKAVAPLVDQLFIMAYDMQQDGVASADAPLISPALGLSDVQALVQYEKLVSPAKLLLGVPFYGYDFTTVDGSPGAPSVTSDPVAVDFSAITDAAHPAYWDPGSLTPYSRFSLAKKHHQTWYDDPISVALKTALAMGQHLAGVGAWALGAEGDAPLMLEALDGTSPPVKLPLEPAP